jgi:gluconokinase
MSGLQRRSESVVVAVDIGSSGVRALAYTEDYRVIASSSRDLSTTADATGRSTHDLAEIVDAVRAALRELAGLGELVGHPILAVSLSGTASSLADPAVGGREVLLWSDTRATAFADAASDRQGTAERFARTLCPSHISYWPAKLRWLSANGQITTMSRFAGAKDLVFEWLTGEFWVDPMTAAATGVFDSSAWEWDEFLATVGIEVSQLPALRDASDSAPILPAVASELGLDPTVRIVLGGMDGPLAQLGAAGFATGSHTCTVGTSIAYRGGVTGRTVDSTERVWCYPVTREFWVAGGAGSNGGNVFTWLSSTLGVTVGELVADALDLAPDPGLLFLPYLNGERAPLWTDDVRAAVIGLSAHHGPSDIARAALDGVGAAAIELADAVTAVVGPARDVRMTGGFLQNSAWATLVTDSLGVETCVPDPEAATSTGAAVLAWMSLGNPAPVSPLPAIATQWRRPDAAAHAVLRNKSDAMRATREALLLLKPWLTA